MALSDIKNIVSPIKLAFRVMESLCLSSEQTNSGAKYPTLIHFGAAHGLMQTVAACLRYCPAALKACALKNIDGMCPKEMAVEHGYLELSEDLQDFEVYLYAIKTVLDGAMNRFVYSKPTTYVKIIFLTCRRCFLGKSYPDRVVASKSTITHSRTL